jgi:tetratricopeptide (TPR) repeat protein
VRYNRQKENPEKRQALLDQVRELAADIQAPNLAADMLYWLANQVRVFDKGKAVKIYRRLINQYPESDAAPDARYAVCETFYDAGLYGEALGAYRELLSVLPDRKVTIQSQIQRCKRNIRRKHLAFGGWLLLGTLVGTTLLAAKQGVNSCGWRVGLWSGMLLLGVLGFGAWTIREQFINSTILICFVVGLSVLGGVAYPMSKTLRDWIGQWRSAKRYHLGAVLMESFVGIACGVFVVVSGVYVLIYHVYPHYLIVFKL